MALHKSKEVKVAEHAKRKRLDQLTRERYGDLEKLERERPSWYTDLDTDHERTD